MEALACVTASSLSLWGNTLCSLATLPKIERANADYHRP